MCDAYVVIQGGCAVDWEEGEVVVIDLDDLLDAGSDVEDIESYRATAKSLGLDWVVDKLQKELDLRAEEGAREGPQASGAT